MIPNYTSAAKILFGMLIGRTDATYMSLEPYTFDQLREVHRKVGNIYLLCTLGPIILILLISRLCK